MALILEPKSYPDISSLVQALAVAVQGGLLSREQAQPALKDQLYACGVLKRPVAPEKIEKPVGKKV